VVLCLALARIGKSLGIAAVAWLVASGCSPAGDPISGFSLLAVGDTGAPAADEVDYPRMLAVTGAVAAADRRHAASALLLLGDNFYPRGLKNSELVDRVRANLVRPFCRFVATGGPRYREVAVPCDGPKRPLPLFAVLGNHDYQTAESPGLQREVVADFVSNWQMPSALAQGHDFAGGVSLIWFDSEAVIAGADLAPLVAALRDSAGPFRILAGHRPIATSGAVSPTPEFAAYRESIRQAVAEAGVTVQLFVSGHEHRLALMTMSAPDPALHLIVGSGSNTRKNRADDSGVLADFESLGFARIDRVDSDDIVRLRVSLYRVHPLPLIRRFVDLAARWSVDTAGRVYEEDD